MIFKEDQKLADTKDFILNSNEKVVGALFNSGKFLCWIFWFQLGKIQPWVQLERLSLVQKNLNGDRFFKLRPYLSLQEGDKER